VGDRTVENRPNTGSPFRCHPSVSLSAPGNAYAINANDQNVSVSIHTQWNNGDVKVKWKIRRDLPVSDLIARFSVPGFVS
jgi:hypothetical protein